MTDRERAEAIYSLQEIARIDARIYDNWINAQIEAMELQFILKGDE